MAKGWEIKQERGQRTWSRRREPGSPGGGSKKALVSQRRRVPRGLAARWTGTLAFAFAQPAGRLEARRLNFGFASPGLKHPALRDDRGTRPRSASLNLLPGSPHSKARKLGDPKVRIDIATSAASFRPLSPANAISSSVSSTRSSISGPSPRATANSPRRSSPAFTSPAPPSSSNEHRP